MVFAKNLRQIGDEFRESELMSTDVSDNTVWDEDWTQMEVFISAIPKREISQGVNFYLHLPGSLVACDDQ